jgi:hypothetical protein
MIKKGVEKKVYLHIGEGIMVRKSEVITILDARKIQSARNSHLFFGAFQNEHSRTTESIKSFVLIDPPVKKNDRGRRRFNHLDKRQPIVLVSAIASTTLQKRFNDSSKYLSETESRLK